MKHLLILIALAASAQQIKINPITGLPDLVGSSGSGCTAGTGITCVGSTISVDTAVIQSRATAQAGTSTYCRSTTGNDTYTCAMTPTLTAYTTGSCVTLNPDTANTGAATLNIDALGAKSILTRALATPTTGDIPANINTTLCYDGTQFVPPAGGGTEAHSVSGTKALDTDAIASGACDTLATTTATGATSTDIVTFSPNADITGVTGYAPVTTGGLAIYVWLTTNTINWKVCNPTASSITPGAVTLNWRVAR